MSAYYNEFDPFAAQWLRNLIAGGHIAPGDVDERSIADIQPDDLRGYTQCHFFAGIGGWSYALRLAGWPDDRSVWTGSCPCQPFSAAGRQKGEADERHLWPEFRRLIAERNPATVFGEQVASKLGRDWLAGVRSDLEALGYAVGAADLCAASVGAPHIRQRLWWVAQRNCEGAAGDRSRVADASTQGWGALQRPGEADGRPEIEPDGHGHAERLAHPDGGLARHRDLQPGGQYGQQPQDGGAGGRLGRALGAGLEGRAGEPGELRAERQRAAVERDGEAGGVANPIGADQRRHAGNVGEQTDARSGEARTADGNAANSAGATERLAGAVQPGRPERRSEPRDGSSPWSGGALIPCADGKARRIGPQVFPLVDGLSFKLGSGESIEGKSRVGLLRCYGNAIVPQVAAEFIAAFMETRP